MQDHYTITIPVDAGELSVREEEVAARLLSEIRRNPRCSRFLIVIPSRDPKPITSAQSSGRL